MSSLRFDRSDLGALRRTPQGGIVAPATLTRSGVFRYLQPDGSWRREYRSPEEVFKASHLSSIASAPVTNLHPDSKRVDSLSWRSMAVGHAGESVRQDGSHVAADLYIQDAETIAQIERGERNEVSLGYDQDLVIGAGTTPEGEEYDAIQTNLRANHIALVPRGRAGRSVSLRLDAEDDEVPDSSASMISKMTKITIAGKEYDAGSPEAEKALADLSARVDAAEKAVAAAKTREVKATALGLLTKRKIKADFRADADASEIMVETIKKIAPGVSAEGQSDEWIAGAFAVAIAMALDINAEPEPTADDPAPADGPAPAPGAGAAARADAVDARNKSKTRNDAGDEKSADEIAREKMVNRGRTLGRPQKEA